MPRGQHREQLIAQLGGGHRATLLVTRAKEQREHVRALLEVGLIAAALDLRFERGVGCAQAAREQAARAQRS
jgi:hypothetical protein